MKGILLTPDGDISVINRHLVVSDTLLQDTSIALQLKQGELKEDPLLGPNLVRLIRAKADKTEIERLVKIHLSHAGIEYENIKNKLNITLNENN